jgi:type IV secretory pathway TrbD component
MALRAIPIRRAGNRENLFMGGDRELVMFSGLLAGALIFSAKTYEPQCLAWPSGSGRCSRFA